MSRQWLLSALELAENCKVGLVYSYTLYACVLRSPGDIVFTLARAVTQQLISIVTVTKIRLSDFSAEPADGKVQSCVPIAAALISLSFVENYVAIRLKKQLSNK